MHKWSPVLVTSLLAICLNPVLPLIVSAADESPKTCACMAADPHDDHKKHKRGPLHHMISGLGKELGADFSDMGKDAMFVFSAQGFDPYDSKPGNNPKRPYVVGEATMVDGTSPQIVRFPDRSLRVYGGDADGSYACPRADSPNTFDVHYSNGQLGVLVLLAKGEAEIKRPDGTVTKITRTASGTYEMRNSKLGYIGEINPDQTGLNYQFARMQNPTR